MARPVYPVFLSSLCRGAPGLWELRLDLFSNLGESRRIYVDEQVNRREKAHPHLETVDDLITRIREADVFVCILAGSRHGTPILVHGLESRASFFEIELYQAALQRKRIHVLVRDDFDPDPRLAGVLRMLGEAFPKWRDLPRLDEAGIRKAVSRLAFPSPFARRPSFPPARAPFRRLVQALHRARDPATPLLFLRGRTDPAAGPPRIAFLRALMEEIPGNGEEQRLSRLWLGLRELAALSPARAEDPELLEVWSRLLAAWGGAGSWYGLHGDMGLGAMAAFNSLWEVRRRLAVIDPRAQGPGIEFPGGPLASAKYSIAKRLIARADRVVRFREALDDVQTSIGLASEMDLPNLLAIRGSIHRQLGAIDACLADYEEVLKMRQRLRFPAHAIGQAASELGFAYMRTFRRREGLRYCEEGIELMRAGGHPGFLARALRKMAVAYAMGDRVYLARKAYDEAAQLARDHTLLDQRGLW